MISIENILLLFFAGLSAGFINVVAGGGSILTISGLIYTGLEATVANGTNRIAVFFQSVVAMIAFRKQIKENLLFYTKVSLITMPGAALGAFFATEVSDDLLELIIGVVILIVILTIIIPMKNVEYQKGATKIDFKIGTFLVLGGFYGGFLQMGLGFVLIAILHRIMKYNLLQSNIMKVYINFIFTIPVLIVFAFGGKIVLISGLALALGNSTGAWISAKISLKKGDKFIKLILVISAILISLKLLKVI